LEETLEFRDGLLAAAAALRTETGPSIAVGRAALAAAAAWDNVTPETDFLGRTRPVAVAAHPGMIMDLEARAAPA
jgi:hypothetical protein